VVLAHSQPGWVTLHRDHAERGLPAHGGQDAGYRVRLLGSRLLPQVSEQASPVHRELVERGELGRGREALPSRTSRLNRFEREMISETLAVYRVLTGLAPPTRKAAAP
jgi:hypothetical protein